MVLEVVASLRHHMHRVVCRQFKLYIICHLLYRHYTDIECNYPWEEKSSRAGLNCLLCKAALCRHSTVDNNCISMIILQETPRFVSDDTQSHLDAIMRLDCRHHPPGQEKTRDKRVMGFRECN